MKSDLNSDIKQFIKILKEFKGFLYTSPEELRDCIVNRLNDILQLNEECIKENEVENENL